MQTLGGLIKKKEKTKCLPKSARTPLFSMNIFLHTSIQIDKIKLRMEWSFHVITNTNKHDTQTSKGRNHSASRKTWVIIELEWDIVDLYVMGISIKSKTLDEIKLF